MFCIFCSVSESGEKEGVSWKMRKRKCFFFFTEYKNHPFIMTEHPEQGTV